jgi:hypothetical protein
MRTQANRRGTTALFAVDPGPVAGTTARLRLFPGKHREQPHALEYLFGDFARH